MVGSSGVAGLRTDPVEAKPRSLPDLMVGTTEPPPNIADTSPASTAIAAGPPPRYGTWVRSMPTCCLSISIAR